ncbi:MAG: NAD(P)H-dependent glycerol-3-phosphate dehydrogenase [Halopseudomonas sp.]
MGDLILTCTGHLSRNRMVGQRLAEGMTMDALLAETRMVAEGVATSVSVHDLALRQHVETPISEEVYQVIFKGKSVPAAMESLMDRPLRAEWAFGD